MDHRHLLAERRPTPSNWRAGKLMQKLRNKTLVSFFVLADGVSWLLWIPVVILGLPGFNPAAHAPRCTSCPASP
jgi:hypothetical protein